MLGRVADVVALTKDERRFLKGKVRRHTAPRLLSDRCRMILLCAEGLSCSRIYLWRLNVRFSVCFGVCSVLIESGLEASKYSFTASLCLDMAT